MAWPRAPPVFAEVNHVQAPTRETQIICSIDSDGFSTAMRLVIVVLLVILMTSQPMIQPGGRATENGPVAPPLGVRGIQGNLHRGVPASDPHYK